MDPIAKPQPRRDRRRAVVCLSQLWADQGQRPRSVSLEIRSLSRSHPPERISHEFAWAIKSHSVWSGYANPAVMPFCVFVFVQCPGRNIFAFAPREPRRTNRRTQRDAERGLRLHIAFVGSITFSPPPTRSGTEPGFRAPGAGVGPVCLPVRRARRRSCQGSPRRRGSPRRCASA
jgi:hypothetical protein